MNDVTNQNNMSESNSGRLIEVLPKTELHLHIEGTLEPEMLFALAERNNVRLPFANIDALRRAYNFHNLQSFLDLYYQGTAVLQNESDFYDLMMAYLRRAAADKVVRSEIFFDPQSHTSRGVPFATVIHGLTRAIEEARETLGIDAALILCFLRHLDEKDAFQTLREAEPYLDRIIGIGLDSSEKGHPPRKFRSVFSSAGEWGLHRVAHAGEEGPPEYIWEALDLLKVERIDHGVRCVEDDRLMQRLKDEKIPLTVCPLSNVRLRVYAEMEEHPVRQLMERGLVPMINSDDPAYFGGYLNANYQAVEEALGLSSDQMLQLVQNSLSAAFWPAGSKNLQRYQDDINRMVSMEEV